MGKSVEQELDELKALIESAGEELPERYLAEQLQKACWCSTQKPTTCGLSLKKYNEALDKFLPILAKYKMRIAELEAELKAWEETGAIMRSQDKDGE